MKIRKSLTEMALAAERVEAARLAGELLCPLTRRSLKITQGRQSGRWFVTPCELSCKGCDLPNFFRFKGWETREELRVAFQKESLVEELIP